MNQDYNGDYYQDDAAKSSVAPPASQVVTIRAQRTFPSKVTVYLGRDARGRDNRVTFPAVFRLLPMDQVRQLQEEGHDGAFTRAVLVSADVNMVDENDQPYPNKIDAIANDPSVSAAVVTTYLRETVSKNDCSKK